jgi:hypothetical protein
LKLEFDDDVAATLIGKYVLAGITHRNRDTDHIEGYSQLHGRIVAADKVKGILVRHPATGSEFTLPPATNRFEQADAGVYRLKASGEEVVDPDLLCTWTLYPK